MLIVIFQKVVENLQSMPFFPIVLDFFFFSQLKTVSEDASGAFNRLYGKNHLEGLP